MYKLRTCYVNCAEHLLNTNNVNIIYDDSECTWSDEQWTSYIRQIKGFGYNNFQIWIPPTVAIPGKLRENGLARVKKVMDICHKEGILFNPLVGVNILGGEWYFACPNDKKDKAKILEYINAYLDILKEADIFTLFPGDPGGCNRNGCTHMTFIELAAELAWIIKEKNPDMTVEVGTWGTPFSGWGEDLRKVENWDGTFKMLIDPTNVTPEVPCHIWNGSEQRAMKAMQDLVDNLHKFPKDTMFSINAGFNPDCEPIGAYDGLRWAKIISKTHRVNSWDYSASEGELICYPHWRIPKFKRKRMMEMDAAQYNGAICYTMTPKLSQLMQYSAAQIMINPQEDADKIASRFSQLVFGDEKIGTLMEAFEIVNGWGFEPRKKLSKTELSGMLTELVERLKKAKGKASEIEIFPSAEEYRLELIWHAENFIEMLGKNPDRDRIKYEYREHLLSVYENVPEAVDERTILSAKGYSEIGENIDG